MKRPITKEALEKMLEEHPPEVVATYAAEFDDEARAHFEIFSELVADLQALPEDLQTMTQPPKFVPQQTQVVPFPMRRIAIPAWSVPLAAAALITLGFMIPQNQGHDTLPVGEVRSVDNTADPYHSIYQQHDMAIASSLMNRAMKFQETREFERAWQDYKSAWRYLPKDAIGDREMLKEQLKIVAEEMKDTEKLKFLESME